MEGITYWIYGFSNFAWFAEMLLDVTNGRVDLFADERVELIAGYAQRSFLKGNTTVSFSDGARNGCAADELQYYLTQRYPDSVHMLPHEVSVTWDGNVSWIQWTRALLHTPPANVERFLSTQNYDFPIAAQTIVHTDAYSLFAKAGHNREEHNHNDVGSFILSTDEVGQVFCDIGSGLYTRDYFQPTMQKRYAILCNSSLGHSVPIVNGMAQQYGQQYAGQIRHEGNCIEIDMAGAYGQKSFTRLTRVLEHRADGVRLTDSFSPCESFTERFVTMIEPTEEAGGVRVANVLLKYDSSVTAPQIHTETHINSHAKGEAVWCIDFSVAPDAGKVSFEFLPKK